VWNADDPWFRGIRATHNDLVKMIRDIKSTNPTDVLSRDDPIHRLLGFYVKTKSGVYHRFTIGLLDVKMLAPTYKTLREMIRSVPKRKELSDMLVGDEPFEELWPKISY